MFFFSPHLCLGLSKYSSSKIIAFCMCFNCDPLLLCWSPAGVVVKCEGVGEFYYLPIQSQSLSGPVSVDSYFHGIISSMPASFK